MYYTELPSWRLGLTCLFWEWLWRSVCLEHSEKERGKRAAQTQDELGPWLLWGVAERVLVAWQHSPGRSPPCMPGRKRSRWVRSHHMVH